MILSLSSVKPRRGANRRLETVRQKKDWISFMSRDGVNALASFGFFLFVIVGVNFSGRVHNGAPKGGILPNGRTNLTRSSKRSENPQPTAAIDLITRQSNGSG